MTEEVLPYSEKYPPAWIVSRSKGGNFGFHVEGYRGIAPPKEKDEEWHIVVEAFRSMANTCGGPLLFTRPEISTSFVYRSEREFLQSYDQRFAWKVHFYQTRLMGGRLEPDRYMGVLFLRPWDVHVNESRNPDDAVKHKIVAPAVCEGYVRSPKDIALSPYISNCMRNYSAPYGLLPYDSIPFLAGRFGSDCGHSILATAMLMGNLGVIYSPYEVAAASTTHQAILMTKTTDGPPHYVEISGLQLPVAKYIVETFCRGRVQLGTWRIGDATGSISDEDRYHMSQILSSFIYQGIPILFPIDYSQMYKKNDDRLLENPPVDIETSEEDAHLILIHGIARSRQKDGSFPTFLFSDPTDLHSTGNIFQRVSVDHLMKSRLRKTKVGNNVQESEKGPPYNECVYGTCVSKEFTVDYQSMITKSQGRTITLRHREQLAGFLLQAIHPDIYDNPQPSQSITSQIKDALRKMDISDYVWILSSDNHREGNFESTTVGIGEFCGQFSRDNRSAKLTGYSRPGESTELTIAIGDTGKVDIGFTTS